MVIFCSCVNVYQRVIPSQYSKRPTISGRSCHAFLLGKVPTPFLLVQSCCWPQSHHCDHCRPFGCTRVLRCLSLSLPRRRRRRRWMTRPKVRQRRCRTVAMPVVCNWGRPQNCLSHPVLLGIWPKWNQNHQIEWWCFSWSDIEDTPSLHQTTFPF